MNPLFRQIALVAVLVLAACAPATGGAPSAAPAVPGAQRDENQVLRVAVGGLIGNMTPQSSSSNLYQFWPIYDNLTQFGANYEVRPSLAEKWDVSADGLTWTFTLRQDVTWPNGDKLTAEDVAFTMGQIIEKNWPQRAFFGTTTGARAVDERTVTITTRQPDMSVPNGGPYLWVLPKKYFEQVGFDGFVQKPMGSGPYDVVEFKTADTIHYRKRAAKHAFRSPQANEIIFKAIPDNGTIVAGLRTGDIDIAAQINFSTDQADQLKRADLTVLAYLASNTSFALPQGAAELRQTPIRDRRVRLAMNYAVDKDALVRSIFRGYAEPVGQLAVPGSLSWDPDLKPVPYDPAMARRLLAEAGYPNGLRLTGGLDYTPSMASPDLVIAVQSYLREVGIEVEAQINELGVFVDKAYGRNNLVRGDIWGGGTGDGNGFFTQGRVFNGCGKPVGGPPSSVSYCNPEWDRTLDLAFAERDPAKRAELFRQATRIYREDYPNIFMVARSIFIAHNPKVRDVRIAMPLAYNFDTAYKVK